MALMKNTVRLIGQFYNFSGILSNASDISIDISEERTNVPIIQVSGSEITLDSIGKYHYDFTIPLGTGNILYEWSGLLEGSPITNRGIITREWLR
jgi:hypothetical protein